MPFLILESYEDDHVKLIENDIVYEYTGFGLAKKDLHLLVKLTKEVGDDCYEIPMNIVMPISEKKIKELKTGE